MTDQPALPFDPCPDTAAMIRAAIPAQVQKANAREQAARCAHAARLAAESGVPAQRGSDVRGYVLAAISHKEQANG